MQSQAHCPTDMSLDWIPTTATTRSQCTCSSPYWKQDYRHFRRAMELKWNPSSAFSRTTLKWGYLQAMHVADSQLINEMCWPSSPSSPADEGLRGCHVLFIWLLLHELLTTHAISVRWCVAMSLLQWVATVIQRWLWWSKWLSQGWLTGHYKIIWVY